MKKTPSYRVHLRPNNIALKNVFVGLVFSILWASAAVATKFGVVSAPPLLLATCRFFIAGSILLVFSYALNRGGEYRLPNRQEWKQLSLFGFLNTTVYLGLYVYAMKYTAAGIGSLAVSTNPLIITVLSAVYLKRKPAIDELISIFMGMAGIALASWPYLRGGFGSVQGLVLLLLSMLAVSIASVYYASRQWQLPNLLINGWQVLLGGVFLVPFTLLSTDLGSLRLDLNFGLSVAWLSLAVSVVALICWFYLLRLDTVRASLWLFLCPVFGFFFAWWLMDEPITLITISGTVLVMAALYIGQRKRLAGLIFNSIDNI